PLAKRFAENYQSGFHFQKNQDRGRTDIFSVSTTENIPLIWERGENADILRIVPASPIAPNSDYSFTLKYKIKVTEDRFTRFGVTKTNDYKLRYWYISPAVYDGQWQVYSNKNLDDLYLEPSIFEITFHYP